jgi:hypothetical protein
MPRIDINIGENHDVTIYNVVGSVAVEDFVSAMQEGQKSATQSKAMLDITEACLSHLQSAELTRAVAESRKASLARAGGRIAIVAPLDTSLKVLKFCATFAGGLAAPSGSYHFVADRDEAIAWLSDGDN